MASLRNQKIVLGVGQEYDFPINGDSVRVVKADVPIYFKTRDGSLDFYLEQGEKAVLKGDGFSTLVIYHLDLAEQSIVISVGKGADIGSARFSGNVNITGAVDLSASTLTALETINGNIQAEEYTSSYVHTTNLAANTASQIFSPAANVNGAIIHNAQLLVIGNNLRSVLIAKSGTPANITDGAPILGCIGISTGVHTSSILNKSIKLNAGLGLYRISDVAESIAYCHVLYTLL